MGSSSQAKHLKEALPGKKSPYQTDDLGLSMYTCPPTEELSVRELEDITVNRLKLLHICRSYQ